MKIIAALELIFWLVVLYGIVRQVIVPLWNGEKMFPLLRKRRDIEVALRDARTELTDAELSRQLRAQHEKLSQFAVSTAESSKSKTPKSKSL